MNEIRCPKIKAGKPCRKLLAVVTFEDGRPRLTCAESHGQRDGCTVGWDPFIGAYAVECMAHGVVLEISPDELTKRFTPPEKRYTVAGTSPNVPQAPPG